MQHDFKIAVIATAYFPLAHADVMVSRWLEPRPTDPQWGWPVEGDKPRSRIVSFYIAPSTHTAPDDPHRFIGREVAQKYEVPVFETVREALTLGGDTLAVDGVLLIGEHGDYPLNEHGQKTYPRFEFWREIVQVMRDSKQFVPLFSDKHLSYDNAKAIEMYETSCALGIPFMAGSSLPFCKMTPPMEVARGAELDEAVTLFYGSAESYGFHILEVTESLIESRRGGESGIVRVAAFQGEEVWQKMEEGLWSRELFEEALKVSKRVSPGDPRDNCRAVHKSGTLASPIAFCAEHADGFRATHISLRGHLQEFVVALREKKGRVQAGMVDAGDAHDFYGHFAAQDRAIENFFLHRQISAPLERTLLTTLTINTFMEALKTPGQWRDTPHLMRPYTPPDDLMRAQWPQRPPKSEPVPRAYVE